MAKRGRYGFEADEADAGTAADPEALPPGAGTVTVKDTAGNDVVVVITAEQARVWWANVPPKARLDYQKNFVNANAPTDDELVAAYVDAHAPATPERANAWWDTLSTADKKAYQDSLIEKPADDVLVKLYDSAHALETPTALAEDTPPRVQPATPGASATNPDLMFNGVEPVVDAPLYAGMPRRAVPPEMGNLPGMPPESRTARGQERMRTS
jgi:hypothetical protein